MNTDLIFPRALCKAQWSIWLHALEMCEIIGSHTLQHCAALTRAEADALVRAEDWASMAMAPMQALRRSDPKGISEAPSKADMRRGRLAQALPSRQATVNDALRTLHTALTLSPSSRQLRAARKATVARAGA